MFQSIKDMFADIRDQYRYQAYLATTSRPAESKTIGEYLRITKKLIEDVVTENKGVVSFQDFPKKIMEFEILPPNTPTLKRLNINMASAARLGFEIERSGEYPIRRQGVLDIGNTSQGNFMFFQARNPDNPRQMTLRAGHIEPLALDFVLINKHLLQKNQTYIADYTAFIMNIDLPEFPADIIIRSKHRYEPK